MVYYAGSLLILALLTLFALAGSLLTLSGSLLTLTGSLLTLTGSLLTRTLTPQTQRSSAAAVSGGYF